jgi:hypothetical protein
MIEYVDKIKATFDEDERRDIIWETQLYYWNDLVAMIPAIDAFRPHAVRSEWQGLMMVPADAFYPDFRSVRLKA